jgi:predicted Fe-Mo cluster-binding NifX family protein
MRIAIAVRPDLLTVSGHAGQTPDWLVFDCQPDQPVPLPQTIHLPRELLPHHFRDDGPHPLHGVEIIVAASAGEGFVRHMRKWGATVLLTGEREVGAALQAILRGEALPDPRCDLTTTLCRLRDLFSRH